MKIKKLTVRDFLQKDEIVSKKAQRWILGGYGGTSCGMGVCCFSKTMMGEAEKCPDNVTCGEWAGKTGWYCCNGASCCC